MEKKRETDFFFIPFVHIIHFSSMKKNSRMQLEKKKLTGKCFLSKMAKVTELLKSFFFIKKKKKILNKQSYVKKLDCLLGILNCKKCYT